MLRDPPKQNISRFGLVSDGAEFRRQEYFFPFFEDMDNERKPLDQIGSGIERVAAGRKSVWALSLMVWASRELTVRLWS